MVGRLLTAAAALAIAAGLGLGLYQARNQDAGEGSVLRLRPLSPAREDQVSRQLDRAGTLNPDVQPAIDRGILALIQQRPRRADRVLLAAARSEPDNIAAWAWLANAARAANDTRLAALARARILALRPLGLAPG